MKKLPILLPLIILTSLATATNPGKSESKDSVTAVTKDSLFSQKVNLMPVYIHIIRHSDGTGGRPACDVDKALCGLNATFNPYNIYLYCKETIDYIDNDSCYTHTIEAADSTHNHLDGIDIYLYDDAPAVWK